MSKILISIICFFGIFACENSISGNDKFPKKRPKNVRLYSDTGILRWYGGNKWLTTGLKLRNGEERDYFRVSPDLINGIHYDCLVPPSIYNPNRDTLFCPDWSDSIIIGKTRVRVTYWWGLVQGDRDRITDELFTLPE